MSWGISIIQKEDAVGADADRSGKRRRNIKGNLIERCRLKASLIQQIAGGGDYFPHTSATRILFLVNSLIGASVLSLVLSYLVQV